MTVDEEASSLLEILKHRGFNYDAITGAIDKSPGLKELAATIGEDNVALQAITKMLKDEGSRLMFSGPDPDDWLTPIRMELGKMEAAMPKKIVPPKIPDDHNLPISPITMPVFPVAFAYAQKAAYTYIRTLQGVPGEYRQLCQHITAYPHLSEGIVHDVDSFNLLKTAITNMLLTNEKNWEIFETPDPHNWITSILIEMDGMEKRVANGQSEARWAEGDYGSNSHDRGSPPSK
jgi:hypothetical protein